MIGLDPDAGHGAEVDARHAGDVCDREAISRDELAIRKLPIEPLQALLGHGPTGLSVVGDLGNAPLEEVVGVAEGLRDRKQHLEFHAPLPHLHQRAVASVDTQERRLGLYLLEVATDGHALGQKRAIVELEQRKRAHGVPGQKLGRAILGLADVDLDGGNLDSLLGEKYTNAAGVRSQLAVVELHGDLLGLG